jgi:dihydropteroate synthase
MPSDRRHPSLGLLDKPFAIMGVINVTPDSFYGASRALDPSQAIAIATAMIGQGADIIDVGGESTRPGSQVVSAVEELLRVVPVIRGLREANAVIPISIDTTKASVARAALEAGATWINDVSAGRFDPAMALCAAKAGCPVCLMHSRKTPLDMQDNPVYNDVTAEVITELSEAVSRFVEAGVAPENIILDPGIGFAKRPDHSIRLLAEIGNLVSLGYPVLVGTSRKSFIGRLTGSSSPDLRLAGTLASVAAAWYRGVKIFRVHDVAETRDFLTVLTAIGARS